MNNKLNVLILDDEKRFTEELTEFLQNSGFQTFEANTGAQGLSLLKKQFIDLLILDVRLPGVNGLDILVGNYTTLSDLIDTNCTNLHEYKNDGNNL